MPYFFGKKKRIEKKKEWNEFDRKRLKEKGKRKERSNRVE